MSDAVLVALLAVLACVTLALMVAHAAMVDAQVAAYMEAGL